MKVIGAGAVLAFVVAALIGCGGDSSTSNTLTKAEFIKQADAMCRQAENQKNKDVEAAFDNPKKSGISQEGAKGDDELVNEVALPPLRKMTEELSELGAPEGQEETVEAMIAAMEAEIEKIGANPEKAIRGEVGLFEEADRLAKKLGLETCSLI